MRSRSQRVISMLKVPLGTIANNRNAVHWKATKGIVQRAT